MKPIIKTLHYNVIPGSSVDYDSAQEIREETDEFILVLNQEKASFEMKGHFTLIEDARAIVNDFLERWQVIIGLESDPGDLKFRYETAKFEQIQQNGRNQNFLSVHVGEIVVVSDKVKIHISRNKFPNRPYHFKLSPDVITMYKRYNFYRKGKESLTSMAYMCLTVFEASARTHLEYNKNNNLRGKASHRYNIEYDVLSEIGRLTTVKGNEIEVRKAPKDGTYKPLKPDEKDWLIRAIKTLIKRAGEWEFDRNSQMETITLRNI